MDILILHMFIQHLMIHLSISIPFYYLDVILGTLFLIILSSIWFIAYQMEPGPDLYQVAFCKVMDHVFYIQ